MCPGADPGCFGPSRECTREPTLFVWVVVAYILGYSQSAYPDTLRHYTLQKTPLPYSLTLEQNGWFGDQPSSSSVCAAFTRNRLYFFAARVSVNFPSLRHSSDIELSGIKTPFCACLGHLRPPAPPFVKVTRLSNCPRLGSTSPPPPYYI